MGLRETLEAATQEPNRMVGRSRQAVVADMWLKDHAPELAALCLDMGEALRAAHDPERWSDFLAIQVEELLARLDQLGKEQTDG